MFKLGGTDGNNNITIGGVWNSDTADQDVWIAPTATNPFAGLTEFRVCWWIQPDAPFFSQVGAGHLIHQGGAFYWNQCFQIRHAGNGVVVVKLTDAYDTGNFRTATSGANALNPGFLAKCVLRWKASPETFKLTINGVDVPMTVSGTAIPHLNIQPQAIYGPLEIGAMSGEDETALAGRYGQIALYTTFGSDADALAYSTGTLPLALSTTGLVRYVDCLTKTVDSFTPSLHWRVTDGFTGTVYGVETRTYNFGGTPTLLPFQGVWGVSDVVDPLPDPIPPPPPPPPPGLHMFEDAVSELLDDCELYELTGFPGKRSTNPVRRVPTDYSTLQGAMDAAEYGDDIQCALSGWSNANVHIPTKTVVDGTTPLMPPRMMRTLTMAPAAVTMAPSVNLAAAISYGGDPSSIRVMSANVANLPTPALRDVYLPDGTVRRVLDLSAKVGPPHAADIPTPLVNVESGWNTSGHVARGWLFRGLRLTGTQILVGDSGAGGGSDPFSVRRGPRAGQPDRVGFVQCLADGDPAGDGTTGVATFMGAIGSRIFVTLSYIDRYYIPVGFEGGEEKVFGSHHEGPGPYHYRGNTLRVPTTFGYWGGGGGGSGNIGVLGRNLTYAQNHHHCPPEWRKSELDPINASFSSGVFAGHANGNGWGVTLDASRTVMTRVSGRGWFQDDIDCPNSNCIVWEPATGLARRVVGVGVTGDNPGSLILAAPWPTQPASPIQVYLQWGFPIVRYNSGVDSPAPTATFTVGSTTVTFSAPLPATVSGRPVGGPSADHRWKGHFLYPNSTFNGGPCEQNQPLSNTWGHTMDFAHSSPTAGGPARPQTTALRQEIVTIASDRRSCTIANPWPGSPALPNPHTFPFSVVTNDGIWREMPSKSFIETKSADYHLTEGNIIDFAVGQGTLHPTTQPAPIVLGYGTCTLAGDIATVTSDPSNALGLGSFARRFIGLKTLYGHPWPYIVMRFTGSQSEFLFNARVIRRVISESPLVLEMEPVDPDLVSQPTSYGPGAFGLNLVQTPWFKIDHQIWRYNVLRSVGNVGPHALTGHADNDGEVTKADMGMISHDNLYIQIGDLSIYGTGAQNIGPMINTQRYDWHTGTGKITEDNSNRVHRHNTVLVGASAGRVTFVNVNDLSGGDPGLSRFTKSKNIEVNDNLTLGISASRTALIGYPIYPALPNDMLDVPTVIRRNVFAGTAALDMANPNAAGWTADGTGDRIAAAIARFPDNAYVGSDDYVGLPNRGSLTDADIEDDLVHRYQLQHIVVGNVDIASDGLSASLSSGGNWPATVQPGQFFRTDAQPTIFRQILNVAGGVIRWGNQPAHPQAGQGSVMAAVTFKGTGVDGLDPGANIPVLAQMVQGVTSLP